MKNQIINQRVKSIKKSLKQKDIDAFIVTNQSNITYITGFTGHDSWAVVTSGCVYLITDSRYIEQANAQCPDTKVIERKDPLSVVVADILKKTKDVKKIAVENTISIAAFHAVKKAVKSNLKPLAGIIEDFRVIKDSYEINSIKAAARIAADALNNTIGHIRPGITESFLAALLDLNISQLNSQPSFKTIVAFGANASHPHYHTGKAKLKKNDTILIDFGAKYNGYCSDITRCFAVGKTTDFYRAAYDVILKAQAAAIAAVKPGVEIKQIDFIARDIIAKAGLTLYGHGTGHGVGLDIHEAPTVSGLSKQILQPGMVITIEPAVYIPGRLGIRIEDDVLVTEKGHRVLTPELYK